jgi:hypothetical protein
VFGIMGILSILRNNSVNIAITTILISVLISKCLSQDSNADSSGGSIEQLPKVSFCDEDVLDNRESTRR